MRNLINRLTFVLTLCLLKFPFITDSTHLPTYFAFVHIFNVSWPHELRGWRHETLLPVIISAKIDFEMGKRWNVCSTHGYSTDGFSLVAGKLINFERMIFPTKSQRSNKSRINDLFLPRNYRTHMRHHVSPPNNQTALRHATVNPLTLYRFSNFSAIFPLRITVGSPPSAAYFCPFPRQKSLNVYWKIWFSLI